MTGGKRGLALLLVPEKGGGGKGKDDTHDDGIPHEAITDLRKALKGDDDELLWEAFKSLQDSCRECEEEWDGGDAPDGEDN